MKLLQTIIIPDGDGSLPPPKYGWFSTESGADCNWNGVARALYFVRCYLPLAEGEEAVPRKVSRLFHTDEDGILYIGSTENNLRQRNTPNLRIKQDTGWARWIWHRLGQNRLGEVEDYPLLRNGGRIGLTWYPLSPAPAPAPREWERAAMLAYVKRYGELPPFNGNLVN